jgi:hypothetical protein
VSIARTTKNSNYKNKNKTGKFVSISPPSMHGCQKPKQRETKKDEREKETNEYTGSPSLVYCLLSAHELFFFTYHREGGRVI